MVLEKPINAARRGVRHMERILVFDKSNPGLGLYTRNCTVGIELDLVHDFIDFYTTTFKRNNKHNSLAVFIEPRIASGFPDLVFASFNPSSYLNWKQSRLALGTDDFKVLLFILSKPGQNVRDIIKSLNYPEQIVIESIERLLDADVITRKNGGWLPLTNSSLFGIKKLVAVEAKVGNIKRVAEQSYLNTWFASHSYALLNVSTPTDNTIKYFQKQGLGLYCKNTRFYKAVEAAQLQLPSSYVSFLFNEWIGRSLQ